VNYIRIYRLWRQEGLKAPKKTRKNGVWAEANTVILSPQDLSHPDDDGQHTSLATLSPVWHESNSTSTRSAFSDKRRLAV